MGSEKENLPAQAGSPSGGAVDIAAEPVPKNGKSEEPSAPHAAEGAGSTTTPAAANRAAPLLIGALLMVALAGAGIFLAKLQLRKEEPPAAGIAAPEPSPSATVIEIPMAEPPTHAGESPPPEKIFNNATDTLKAGAEAIRGAGPSAPGAITDLPPPPASVGNDAIQKAAKDAAKLLAPKREESSTIDLSAPEPEAAIEGLERAAAADAASGDFITPPVAAALENARLAEEVAGLKRALQSDISGLGSVLQTERQHAEEQKAEIARLNAEMERMRASGMPAVQRARAALALSALSQKTLLGEPFRTEFDAYKALEPDAPVLAALQFYADQGLATAPAFRARFPGLRDSALARARREAASGPIAQLGANFASLINLRPAAPQAGASAAAILSRAEAKLAADDLAGAIAELDTLTGGAKAVFAPWLAEVRARLGAEAALRAASSAELASFERERLH